MSEQKVDFWSEFKEYLRREGVVEDNEDAEAYMSIFFDRGYDMETLDDDLYNFCGFLYEMFKRLYGEEAVKGLWFLYDVDYVGYKYNEVNVTRYIKIGKFEYDVVINTYDCKWGSVAEDPEDFNKSVEKFLRETKEKLDNLTEAVKDANFGRCYQVTHKPITQ